MYLLSILTKRFRGLAKLSSRAYLYEAIEECWEKVKAGKDVSREEKARLLLAATHTNQSCTRAVDSMYSASGSTAIYTRNKISHYFTDAQVLKQHGFVNDSRYETAAQIFLDYLPICHSLSFKKTMRELIEP